MLIFLLLIIEFGLITRLEMIDITVMITMAVVRDEIVFFLNWFGIIMS